ncbi:hypothetical protein GGI14_005573 [Coemansia sp. S680]|nr:hypothetical protein GGI14_005573 [Coemansia sp. S680]
MKTLSPFQLLPPHVVELVVNHIAGTRRRIYSGSDDPEEEAELQMPLLWVCHNFRVAVYSRFCRGYELCLNSGNGTVHSTRSSWPDCLEQADYQTQHLAKDLQIEVDIWSIYSGKSSELLSHAPNTDLVFPLVRSLTFFFVSSLKKKQKTTTSVQDIETNITALVQRVKRMVPMANEVKVETSAYSHDVHPSACPHFAGLVSQLYRLTDSVVRSSLNCTVPFWQQHDLVQSIIYSSYQDYNSSESVMQLVRRNASVLRTLDIALEASDITGLIRNDNDGYVCYPRLHRLNLKMLSNCTDSKRPTFTGAAPFPVLQRLQISDQYPFGDDTPFRDNAGTLENLKINIDAESVIAFNRCHVFTSDSHPKLQCVMLGLMPNLVSEHFGSDVACMRFVLDIAPNASVREIMGIDCDQGLSAALPLLHDHTRIQVLLLPNMDISLWDSITLVKSLPVLSDLRTMAPALGSIPTGTTLPKLSVYVLSTYGTINKRFRCWHLNMKRGGTPKDAARCVLLLALICPSFDFVLPPVARHAAFTSQMKKLIATNAFKQHEPRLQRLLSDRL